MPTNSRPQWSLKSTSGKTFFHVRISKRTFLRSLLGLCALAVSGGLSVLAWHHFMHPEHGAIGHAFTARGGDWGLLSVKPILLPPPKGSLDPDFRLGDGLWYFKNTRPAEIGALLGEDGLSAQQVATLLLHLQRVAGRNDLLAIEPPAIIVWDLPSDVRARLYARLASVPENFAQLQPFRMGSRHLADWLGGGTVDPVLAARVKKLLWQSGDTLLFSDYNLIADTISDPAARLLLQQILARKASLILELKIPANADVEPLIEYWRAGGPRENVAPILQSLAASGGGSISVSDLFPSFARQRLYRFPGIPQGKSIVPACHWTTFNFFNTGEPDAAFNSAPGVEREIRTHYTEITGNPRYGDVVLLTEPDGASIHSAVYIADDIVFTKNGPSIATPWVLSTLKDMVEFYPSKQPLTLVYYRRIGS